MANSAECKMIEARIREMQEAIKTLKVGLEVLSKETNEFGAVREVFWLKGDKVIAESNDRYEKRVKAVAGIRQKIRHTLEDLAR